MPAWLPILAFLLVSFAAYLLILALAPEQTARRGLEGLGGTSRLSGVSTGTRHSSIRDSLNRIGREYRHFDFYRNVELSLAQAGWLLKPLEFMLALVVLAVLVGTAVFLLTRNPVWGTVGVIAGPLIAWISLKSAITRRLRKFEELLPDALDLMSSSLRAGQGFQRAMQVTADDMPAPLSDEFRMAVEDLAVGSSVEEALRAMLLRVPSYEMELIATAVTIQLQVGGNLSEILAKISETVRERAKIRGEISTLTAEGRVSAWVVFAIPIALFFWLAASNPEYMKPLLQETTGHYLLGVALCMQMLGMGIIFRMLNMEI
ncbi:MAG: hypothetical protein GYA63_01255 [Armatimonadetes bacterium]|jgi:tight adherence protein B|nr:hypothetical protein [Armatimonadota bacterium]